MELNYRKCAEEIFATLGGKDNIISAAHCATRLRLVIADNSKVDVKTLELSLIHIYEIIIKSAPDEIAGLTSGNVILRIT